jgi:hypothetical protein
MLRAWLPVVVIGYCAGPIFIGQFWPKNRRRVLEIEKLPRRIPWFKYGGGEPYGARFFIEIKRVRATNGKHRWPPIYLCNLDRFGIGAGNAGPIESGFLLNSAGNW